MFSLKKPELLAPAGNFEKLEIAIHYGADAVYLGGKDFSLRNYSGNFSIDALQRAVELAHRRNVSVYVACNIYSRNREQKDIARYLGQLGEIRPDALIIADPGILTAARRIVPAIPVHLSTQANTTNYAAAAFWEKAGVARINAARELTLSEITDIAAHSSLSVEAFVHGAMCISYSGRCLLSSFMENRDANRGMCCHPCRFTYTLMESKRPGQYFPMAEDSRGSYIFNSRDLCMIEHIPEMVGAGITALKIEGRMKGIHYLASVVKVYREAIDRFCEDPAGYGVHPDWLAALGGISHRGYCTGFYFGDPRQVIPDYGGRLNCGRTFVAKVTEGSRGKWAAIEVRNKLHQNDRIEILSRTGPLRADTIRAIRDPEGQLIDFAQPGSRVSIRISGTLSPNDLLRRIPADAPAGGDAG